MDRLFRLTKSPVTTAALLGALLLGLILSGVLPFDGLFDGPLGRSGDDESAWVSTGGNGSLAMYPPGPLRLPDEMRPIQFDFDAVVDSEPTRLASSNMAHPIHLPSARPVSMMAPSVRRLPPAAPPAIAPPAVALQGRVAQTLRLPPVEENTHSVLATVQGSVASDAANMIHPQPGAEEAMEAVSQRARDLMRHAFSLAERGAFYSARAELIQALRIISQALDASYGVRLHSQSLANGLRAMREADDFVPQGSRLEADLQLSSIVVAHRTPVLKQTVDSATPLMALQSYYTYAQEQFAQAGGRQAAASEALFGLGKIYNVMGERSSEKLTLGGPKAMALFQAALLVDSTNYTAANELGVMLARYGQLNDARSVLLHSLSVRRQADTWHNLAVVHTRLGEHDLARRAEYELQLVKTERPAGSRNSAAPVQWISPSAFAQTSPGPRGVNVAPTPMAPPVVKQPTAWRWPWQKTTR